MPDPTVTELLKRARDRIGSMRDRADLVALELCDAIALLASRPAPADARVEPRVWRKLDAEINGHAVWTLRADDLIGVGAVDWWTVYLADGEAEGWYAHRVGRLPQAEAMVPLLRSGLAAAMADAEALLGITNAVRPPSAAPPPDAPSAGGERPVFGWDRVTVTPVLAAPPVPAPQPEQERAEPPPGYEVWHGTRWHWGQDGADFGLCHEFGNIPPPDYSACPATEAEAIAAAWQHHDAHATAQRGGTDSRGSLAAEENEHGRDTRHWMGDRPDARGLGGATRGMERQGDVLRAADAGRAQQDDRAVRVHGDDHGRPDPVAVQSGGPARERLGHGDGRAPVADEVGRVHASARPAAPPPPAPGAGERESPALRGFAIAIRELEEVSAEADSLWRSTPPSSSDAKAWHWLIGFLGRRVAHLRAHQELLASDDASPAQQGGSADVDAEALSEPQSEEDRAFALRLGPAVYELLDDAGRVGSRSWDEAEASERGLCMRIGFALYQRGYDTAQADLATARVALAAAQIDARACVTMQAERDRARTELASAEREREEAVGHVRALLDSHEPKAVDGVLLVRQAARDLLDRLASRRAGGA